MTTICYNLFLNKIYSIKMIQTFLCYSTIKNPLKNDSGFFI
ncbi:hypothetical protein L289_2327 [Acinetobacter gerneri DSM 14967 = CIP 107464 = MTCC 9824]|nr:hypothetical protein L289_2327 [Acinetobacter gerneri DSM 14967 = CIP 107464 = MTCC 9824]